MTCFRTSGSDEPKILTIDRTDRLPKKALLEIYLKESLKKGSICDIELEFSGDIYQTVEGIFEGNYQNERGEKSCVLTIANL